ncbi:hypothetical protein [uncultured Campylobacter sp.]|uniref:hypothetical protein n=1 Tax=uncultured Campylobacter sp. TaxID=218934 RepID=UPI0025D8A4B4|nr:hypothetical protein [uncultured Campylobacter sp.]
MDEVKFRPVNNPQIYGYRTRLYRLLKQCRWIKHIITNRIKGEFKNPAYTFLTDFA